jgi:hypothetical protein
LKTYREKEILTLLKGIDKRINFSFKIVIIGGSAAALAYQYREGTKDIDTANRIDEIRSAYEEAKKDTGLDIPLEKAGVEDGPWHYESRLIAISPEEFKYLSVLVPEKHDLALMKTVRGDAQDFQAILEIHKNVDLNIHVLKDRFINEMTHVLGEKRRIKLHFLSLIEILFGTSEADKIEPDLKGWEA